MQHTRIFAITAALLCAAALFLTGCGGAAARTEPLDYASILQQARPQEENDAYNIYYAGTDGAVNGTAGFTADLTADQIADGAQASLDLLGLDPEDCLGWAASVSQMMTQSYAVVIALPAEGRTDAVKQGLQDFIQQQMELQQNYLPDQYAIAKAAQLTTLPTGEVVLVMGPSADSELSALKEALA